MTSLKVEEGQRTTKNLIKGRLTTWNTFWKWISSIQMALMWIKVGIPVKCSVAPVGSCIMYNEWAWFSLMYILWCDSVWSGNMGHCSQAVSGAIHTKDTFALKNRKTRAVQWRNKHLEKRFLKCYFKKKKKFSRCLFLQGLNCFSIVFLWQWKSSAVDYKNMFCVNGPSNWIKTVLNILFEMLPL